MGAGARLLDRWHVAHAEPDAVLFRLQADHPHPHPLPKAKHVRDPGDAAWCELGDVDESVAEEVVTLPRVRRVRLVDPSSGHTCRRECPTPHGTS